jgi:hypothetical protein
MVRGAAGISRDAWSRRVLRVARETWRLQRSMATCTSRKGEMPCGISGLMVHRSAKRHVRQMLDVVAPLASTPMSA